MPERKAAIAIDAIMERPIADLSAADLLQALSGARDGDSDLARAFPQIL